jgi:hypothetical protein
MAKGANMKNPVRLSFCRIEVIVRLSSVFLKEFSGILIRTMKATAIAPRGRLI